MLFDFLDPPHLFFLSFALTEAFYEKQMMFPIGLNLFVRYNMYLRQGAMALRADPQTAA